MFIQTLQIKNFRCYDKNGITVNFEENTTALIGRNGGGKTAILEALNYVIGSDYLNSKISERDFHKDANNIKDEIVISAYTIKPFFLSVDATSETGQATKLSIACQGVKLTIKRREKAEKILDEPFVIRKEVIPLEGSIDATIFADYLTDKERPILRVNRTFGYFNVMFQLKTNNENRFTRIFDYQLSFNQNKVQNFPKGYYLTKDRIDEVSGLYSLTNKILTDLHWKYQKNHSDTKKDLKVAYDSLATHMREMVDEKQLLINHINSIIREISCEPQSFKLDFIDMERPFKNAFFSKDDRGKTLLPENMGSGFNILIAYTLYSYLSEKEKVPIVLIIDEPELHLHADWQNNMYDIFSQQGSIQILYSTHSENFVSLKNWRQIRNIKNFKVFPEYDISTVQSDDGDIGTPSNFLDDYAKRNLHLSLILRENLELFFTKKCIFVEGPGDKYALPKLLSIMGCELKKYSVAVISVWGKTKIKNYQMICKCFNIEYFTLFDCDDNDDLENTLIINNAQHDKWIDFSPSLEFILGVSGDDKFQKLVRRIDEIEHVDNIPPELIPKLEKLIEYVIS